MLALEFFGFKSVNIIDNASVEQELDAITAPYEKYILIGALVQPKTFIKYNRIYDIIIHQDICSYERYTGDTYSYQIRCINLLYRLTGFRRCDIYHYLITNHFILKETILNMYRNNVRKEINFPIKVKKDYKNTPAYGGGYVFDTNKNTIRINLSEGLK